MAVTPVVLEKNYFDDHVANLIRRVEKDGRVVLDRRTAEEALLDHLPRSWNELLKATKAGLHEEREVHRMESEFWSSRNSVYVERLRKSAKNQQRLIEALGKQTQVAGDTAPLVEAISEWSGKDVRTHKAQVLLNGIPHEHWIQELSFIATTGYSSNGAPIAIWRFRIGALFPKPRGEAEQRELIPEIRIELLEAAILDDPRAPDHLCQVLKRLAETACAHVAWALSMAADELEIYSDRYARWPMSLTMSFPDSYGDVAQNVFALCTAESQFGIPDFRDNLADQESDLMRIVCLSGTATTQPTPKPKSPNRVAKPNPQNPGDVFLLMEFGLTSVALRKDGMMDRSIRIKRYEEFLEEYGQEPDTILSSLQIDIDSLRQLTEYEQVMAILDRAAVPSPWATDDLQSVVWLSGTQRPQKGQPIIRLLVDLATRMMSASIATCKGSITSFLEHETTAGSRLGARPKHLKVAKTLLSSHPDIEAWAARQGVQIVAPSSGADAGAKYVRLWNQIAEQVILFDCHSGWWNLKILQYDAWQRGCMDVVASYCQDDVKAENRTLPLYFLPQSLIVSDEHRAAFLSWRDEKIRNRVT